jgi:hypothetical protein
MAIGIFNYGIYDLPDLIDATVACMYELDTRQYALSLNQSETTRRAVQSAFNSAFRRSEVLTAELNRRLEVTPAEALEAKITIIKTLFQKHASEFASLSEKEPRRSWHQKMMNFYQSKLPVAFQNAQTQ